MAKIDDQNVGNQGDEGGYFVGEPIEVYYDDWGPVGPAGPLFPPDNTPEVPFDYEGALALAGGVLGLGAAELTKRQLLLPAYYMGMASSVMWVLAGIAHFVLKPDNPGTKLDLSGPCQLSVPLDTERSPKRDVSGRLKLLLDGVPVTAVRTSGIVNIQSVAFPNVYLRMDGSQVNEFAGYGSGTINCQHGAGAWERFRPINLHNGTVAFGSVSHPNAFLRMDGSDVTKHADEGGGTVNCQFSIGSLEIFGLDAGTQEGTVLIRSIDAPNRYLRVDGRNVNEYSDQGSGIVNCQFGPGPWEVFRLVIVS